MNFEISTLKFSRRGEIAISAVMQSVERLAKFGIFDCQKYKTFREHFDGWRVVDRLWQIRPNNLANSAAHREVEPFSSVAK